MLPSQYIELGWCQNCLAIDKNFQPVKPDSPDAKAWCLIGAVDASYISKGITHKQFMSLRIVIRNILNDDYIYKISSYNDDVDRSKEQVLDLVKQAEKSIGLSL